MEAQPRNIWNNERRVVAELSSALDRDDTDAVARLGERLLDGVLEDDWQCCGLVRSDVYLRIEQLHSSALPEDVLNHLLNLPETCDARADALCAGTELSWNEIQELCAEDPGERGLGPEWCTDWYMFECPTSSRRT